MEKIVLCIDNGNIHQTEAMEYLAAHQCRIYRLTSMEGQGVSAMIKEIEEKEGRLDLLLFAANPNMTKDGTIGTGHDMDLILQEVNAQMNGTREVLGQAVPLMKKGGLKRIGMITSKSSSIRCCKDDCDYGYHMALAGMNMLGKLYFNLLRPEGFTFRWFCAEEGGMSAGEYLLTGFCYDEKEPYQHSDENRFVMRDGYLNEIAW